MLKRLTVLNLAIVEKAEAEFASGLNVITGETGAGKSVLMGALELVLGGRADSSVVRDGEQSARVEAEFHLSGSALESVDAVLSDSGLPLCEDGVLVVRRTIASSGAGRVWVNDASSTVATLRRIGRLLVDIHGPRANQTILEESFQRMALDSFGRVDRAAYESAWREVASLRGEIAALEGAGDASGEIDLLRFQVAELADAHVTSDDDDLPERHAAAAHAGEIIEGANEITEALGGDGGAADILIRLQPRFAATARHMPDAEAWAREAEEITLRIQELSRTVADAASRIEADPDALEAMDERLAVVNRLKRKYLGSQASPEDSFSDSVAALLESKRARLDALENRDAKLDEMRGRLASLEASLEKRGAELRTARAAAGSKLAKAVTAELHGLGFLKAKFGVRVDAAKASPSGCDAVAYMFEPNPGEGARALSDIASSGETARVMLALKGVLAAHDTLDTLVFDEIDANIGGETGRAVGEKMRSLARHRQVIAITHLPQSAVFGERHIVVAKSVSGGRTRTRLEVVDGDARVKEISRMLGGETSTGVVGQHAAELLMSARG